MTAQADALMGIFGFKRVEKEMKTDRELLELAAKAAGVQLRWIQGPDDEECIHPMRRRDDGMCEVDWNPITDDGDALRLAHALGMQLNLDECNDMNDVRTDILMAAAAIGEQMQ